MMIDVDHFKEVNDNHGHSTGDLVLKTFANVLKVFMKDRDAYVGRWGGEEFVIVCSKTDIKEAGDLAEKLRNQVSKTVFPKAGNCTCSIGVTRIMDGDDLDNAFNRMDKAMYQSKNNGRNCVTVL